MLQALAILGPYGDLALDRFAIEIQRHLLLAVLVELDINGGAVVEVLEHDVDVDRGGEEVRHAGPEKCRWIGACSEAVSEALVASVVGGARLDGRGGELRPGSVWEELMTRLSPLSPSRERIAAPPSPIPHQHRLVIFTPRYPCFCLQWVHVTSDCCSRRVRWSSTCPSRACGDRHLHTKQQICTRWAVSCTRAAVISRRRD